MNATRDEDLLSQHLAGVPGTFEMLVARYTDEVYRFLARFVGNRVAAEDLVQETFLQVYTAAASFDLSRSFKPWLYTIAANKGRDHLRARGRRQELSIDRGGDSSEPVDYAQAIEADDVPAVDQCGADEERAAVRAVIARMPENLRTILLLGYYQQLPYSEIAEILGIPVGTVKSRLHAAVTHFARAWQLQSKAGGRPAK